MTEEEVDFITSAKDDYKQLLSSVESNIRNMIQQVNRNQVKIDDAMFDSLLGTAEGDFGLTVTEDVAEVDSALEVFYAVLGKEQSYADFKASVINVARPGFPSPPQ